MAKVRILRFGIQSLDRLIGTIKSNPDHKVNYGIDISDPEKPEDGKQAEDGKEPEITGLPITSSICLAGPDGTGKSILSLHLASHYLADCLKDPGEIQLPKVLYISTDLTHKMALKGWKHFALDHPFRREEPLFKLKDGRDNFGPEVELSLIPYGPSGGGDTASSIVNYLEANCSKVDPGNSRKGLKAEICFVDLAGNTAGDDWGFVHRLLSILNKPDSADPRHLVVLDAVEGFETLVGDLNAFGEKSSRRSRIAQAMRLASGKCHLLLVVEEGHQQRFPEEFVTDVVIRLRNVNTGRYMRRTVEIEKARGQAHKRGQHPYVLRDGVGSTTGSQENADDPEVYLNGSEKKEHQSYIHVFPSLDFTSREIMTDKHQPPQAPDKVRFAAFGLPYLDNMLGGKGEKADIESDGESDTRGLICGTATALIGDSLTQNSELAKAFLSRAFYSFAEDLRKEAFRVSESVVRDWIQLVEENIPKVVKKEVSAEDVATNLINTVGERIATLSRQLYENPEKFHSVAVLLTTHDTNVEQLADEFYQWVREEEGFGRDIQTDERKLTKRIEKFANQYHAHVIKKRKTADDFRQEQNYIRLRDAFKNTLIETALEKVIKRHIHEHTICRRFEIHDLPAPILMSIFQRSIEKAQRILFRKRHEEALPERTERFPKSWRIRIVIDDLNAFRNTYPDMREDPLILPSLLFMLRREGITSLIVDTQVSGSPDLAITERFESSLRPLVQTRIYTWRLPFYGENRVAITVMPPMSQEYRGLIRELRWETKDKNRMDRALAVDPHFELYTGLEQAQPHPVPLEIRLYCDSASAARYIDLEERIFREIFTPVLRPNSEPRIIVPAQLHEYEPLRDACHIQRDTRLDHTTIIQVNEFWWLRRPRQRRAGAFRPQWHYLNAVTATFRGNGTSGRFLSEPVVDPFWVFQPRPHEEEAARTKAQNNSKPVNSHVAVKRKRDFFDDRCGYGLVNLQEPDQDYVDRVPYTWDFGFLLCNGKAWEEARESDRMQDRCSGSPDEKGKSVLKVWNSLRKANEKGHSEVVSWRDFLGASKLVAEFQSYRTSKKSTAFDFTMLIPESFSCLILEMWLSEAYESLLWYLPRANPEKRRDLTRRLELLKKVGSRLWSGDREARWTLLKGLRPGQNHSLKEILEERTKRGDFQCFSLELYKIWLLLTETLNFEELVDSSSYLNFEFRSKDVAPHAVSARHWYRTASSFMDSLTPEQVEYNWVPVRLPGHFSVRADWFLAVAGGSRSSRLADQAMDLFSSQRANVTRLQEGIGLPTRTLFDSDEAHLRTRLISAPKGKPLENVEYDSLRRIGAQSSAEEEQFFWLWRSGIWAYNRHSRIWHKWLNRSLLWWHAWHQRFGSSWTTGFKVYDLLTKIEFSPESKIVEESQAEFNELQLQSWDKFGELRDILISELEQVNVSTV